MVIKIKFKTYFRVQNKNGIGFKITEVLDIKLDLNKITFNFLKKNF